MLMWIFLLSSVNVYEMLRSLGLNPEVLSHKYVFQLWLKYLKFALCLSVCVRLCICIFVLSLICSSAFVLIYEI